MDFAFSCSASIDSFVTFAIDGRSITAGVAPGNPTSTRVASAGRKKRAGGRVAVQNADGRPAMHIRVDQRLGEMGQELVQAEQLVALAHALAVAVHEHEDRPAAVVEGIQDISGKPDGLVDAERQSGPRRR